MRPLVGSTANVNGFRSPLAQIAWFRPVVWLMKGNPVLGGVLGLAMVINMFIAGTAGTLIPLGLRAMKVDPALASSVFITTFTDVAGFASFLGLATVFLKYLKTG